MKPYNSGVHYWEIYIDDKTENEIKIGVSLKSEFNYDSAFCDYDFGYSFYCIGKIYFLAKFHHNQK
jgi:E3 ubiquitin-protein ligase NRDP1